MHPRLRQHLLIIAGLWLFLYGSFALLSPALMDGPDALHAEMAREMIDRSDFVLLYANGAHAPEQAPLLYWSAAASMRLFGTGAPQARLPLAILMLLLALLVERFARHAFLSLRAGLYAAVCLLLSPGLFLFTRILMPEAIASLWLTAAVFCFWLTEHRLAERNGDAPILPCLGFAVASALNVLTCGLPGVALAISIVLVYLLLTRGLGGTLRRCLQLHPIVSIAVFFLIAAPWYMLAAQADPSHRLQVLMLFTPGNATTPLLLSLCLLPLWMLPWSPFLWNAMGAVPWRTSAARALLPEQKSLLLLGIAAMLPLALFALLPHRQAYTMLPSLPFLAMLTARWLDREAAESETMTVPPTLGRAGMRSATVLLVCGAAIVLGCAVLLLHTRTPDPGGNLPDTLRESYVTLLAKKPGREPVLLAVSAMFFGTLGCWWYRRNYRPHTANLALATGTLFCLTTSHVAFQAISPALSSQLLAASIQPHLRPSNLIVINGDYAAAASLGFYLQRTNLHILEDGSRSHQASSAEVETYESLDRKWPQPERIFLWTNPINLPALPGRVYVVAEGGGKQIVSNKATP